MLKPDMQSMLLEQKPVNLLFSLVLGLGLLCCPRQLSADPARMDPALLVLTSTELRENPAIMQAADDREFLQWQDSLKSLGFKMYNEPAEPERLKANFTFVRTLVSALKLGHSFDFAFEGLDMVSIRKSPDDTFRIFSWHLPLSDGSYLYYGTIQLRTPDGSLKLYPLLDKTYEIPDPEQAITSAADWYGAQYYEIVPYKGVYLLLGWKGHTPEINQKVIDVLTIDREKDQAIFGRKIFDTPEYREQSRVIFRFARSVSMHLVYQAPAGRIIFDHLVPADPSYKGQYAYYGPDLTYDAWILGPEKLSLAEHVPYDPGNQE